MDTLDSVWENIVAFGGHLLDLFTATIFKIGESEISLSTIVYFIVTFILLSYLSKRLKYFLVHKVLIPANLERGTSNSIGMIARFLLLFIGSIVIMQSAGINLSSLSLLAGALGVGIGFGLQNITDNFISGIIILFEKPIKVGDRIVVGNTEGDVISISVRATTILTNDNISIIVPNSEFISSRVINWSHNDRNIRFGVPVGVSYNEDPAKVRKILLEVAKSNENILKEPIPRVFFDEFADSSLNFTLAVWTASHTDKPRMLKSELYFSIFEKFKEEGIEIPFPQRDLHIKSNVTQQH